MINFNSIKTIFFDYDGCLHNSMYIYAPAFRKAYSYLVMQGLAQHRAWQANEISYWLGFNSQEMWKAFMPNLDESIRTKCSNIVRTEMKRLIDEGKPELYEGALEVLSYLKSKGYHLVFISNCRNYYRDSHTQLFNLNEYFEELACSEEYNFIPKHEILSIISARYPKNMVIVGDRMQDMEAGRKNNIYTIGCRYGFSQEGELENADLLIDSIKELKEYF
ncbi:MAG: HAD family hydrolase [Firmicutes bacterium HGW-Firmicutes-12]|nr:MAG: HAD family hydrolase [Firmicutes bacterium HGW-Firmicutes-12]